ncbi:non-specific serine/threonine protein kinase [Ranunculus cassubicifolius]
MDCLKKAGVAIPTYSRISNTDDISKQHVSSATPDSDTAEMTIPSNFPVVSNSQIEAVPMERFREEIAKEKPISFSPQQLEGFTNNYSVVLGSGGYGVVYKGEFPNGERIAVKVLNKNTTNKIDQQFMAEVSTIGRTYHHNLVKLYGFCFDSTITALVYECMENGSLDKYLFGKEKVIEWEVLHKIAIGTAKGIAYLHEECGEKLIHYDIKPDNVLLDAEFSPKVANFGMAKLCNRASTLVGRPECKGTPGYRAVELWRPCKPVTQQCDVYSFGMMLFEIVRRRRNSDVDLGETREVWPTTWMWEHMKNGKYGEMMESFGVDDGTREKAERMWVIAMWCVQDLPVARPLMSSVVKMLEGGGEHIRPPSSPFEHLEAVTARRGCFFSLVRSI